MNIKAPNKQPNQGFWVHFARLFIIAELILAIFISFDRNVFFDVKKMFFSINNSFPLGCLLSSSPLLY